jgi:hypothetical protein
MKCISEEHKDCKGTLHSIKVDERIKTPNGFLKLRDLEVLECDQCKDRFYPAKSLKKISAYKKYSGKFVLRIDPILHAELITEAQKNHRSLNQEVSHLIEGSLLHTS